MQLTLQMSAANRCLQIPPKLLNCSPKLLVCMHSAPQHYTRYRLAQAMNGRH